MVNSQSRPIHRKGTSSLSIAQQLEILKLIFDHIDNGACVVDPEGYITHFNAPYGRFLGLDPTQQIGRHVTEVIESSRMHIVAKTGKAEINERHPIRGHDMIVQRIPIKENGRVIAVFGQVMFKDVKEVTPLATRLSQLQNKVASYQNELNALATTRYSFDSIIGKDPKLLALIKEAQNAAQTGLPVLITGESGTGKELIAQAIHTSSPRRRKPFIRLNCAAIPADLIETELFGYDKGAFTGAKSSGKAGKFEHAHGGTIFLDEIGELPLEMQPKLLRVLEEKEVERIGSNRVTRVDFRLIAASNRNLSEMVQERSFRSDLYYRLNVMPLELMPLRQRVGDIPLLADHFLSQMNEERSGTKLKFSKGAKQMLMGHDWPGNIRELHNIVQRMLATTRHEGEICETDLPIYLHRPGSIYNQTTKSTPSLLKEVVAAAEKQAITEALESCGYNKAKAADILGIHRTLLYKKMKKYQMALIKK